MRKRYNKKPSMPKRPRQHELDTEALAYIRNILPTSWTLQEIHHDYGIDLLVEIFEKGEATGLKFEIQSKGHEHFTIRNRDCIAQPLKVSKLNYFEKLLLPVLLVVYDAQENRARFLWIKPYILQVLDKTHPDWRNLDGDSKITLYVPLSNVFDERANQNILSFVEAEHGRMCIAEGENYKFPGQDQYISKSFALSTRLLRPKISRYLHRTRLTERLSAALDYQSIFIQADAGYGKTWLIHDYINTTNPNVSIWYTFTQDNLDAIRFIEDLASELVRQTKLIGLETLQLIQDRHRETKPDEALAVLINEITNASAIPILLVLEDLHNIAEPVYSAIVAFLVSHPKNLQIIITSRIPLPRSQGKLIAQGQLTIVERLDLEFRLDETRDYLKSIAGLDISPEQVKLLQERTGGWIAAIGLVIEVLQNKPAQSNELFNRLTGFDGNIYNFFAEEVYKILPPEIKFLFKRLAITRSIQPEVVNLFTGRTDGGQVLKDLSKHNTFLIEDQEIIGYYQLHTLFAEFLLKRFRDEEGSEAIGQAHNILANYYFSHRKWYLAAEHAIEGKEWYIAVQSLEIISPIGVSLGYGHAILAWIEKIPKEFQNSSALLCEVVGLSALQVGDLVIASQEFGLAKNLYVLQEDAEALNRLEYYAAEVDLDSGVITPEDFLKTTHKVASWSYQHNEVLFGVQVELRLIQVGQTISMKYSNLFSELAKRSEALITKIDTLGSEYEIIKAKVLSSQAHLMFQGFTLAFQKECGKIQLREKLGHPIAMDERVKKAKIVTDGLQIVWELYDEAEKIAKVKIEIEWAIIRMSHLRDFAHHLSQIFLMGLTRAPETSSKAIELEQQIKSQLFVILGEIDHCVQIFEKFNLMSTLAKSLCDAADIYDVLGDISNRDRLAKEALDISSERNFVDSQKRAEGLLLNQNTFTSLREKVSEGESDRKLADLNEEEKAEYVNTFLQAYSGDIDLDKIREAISSDVDDMVASAKQRVEWCRHVKIIQDLRHTKSLETIYREIPQKKIVCGELGHESPTPSLSFDTLWPMFKGVFCLGCGSRSLEKLRFS